MRTLILALLLVVFAPLANFAAETAVQPDNANNGPVIEGKGDVKPEGISPKAEEVFRIGAFPVTNSMLVTWIVAILVIGFAQYATRKVKDVPDGAQNFWEWMVESLYDFIGSIVGSDLARTTFWFFATIFLFILFTNWFGLLPGVGTVGWGQEGPHGFEVTRPLLRGGNADLNMTSAMAIIFMICWLFWALKSNGVWGFALHIFGPKGESEGFIKYMMIVVFFCVGFLELLSIGFRPISLSFRLYGNVFAGENLLEAISSIIQHPAWAKHLFSAILPVPFYFLELLVGIVQAMVFMLLTAVFTALICTHDDHHDKAAHEHAH